VEGDVPSFGARIIAHRCHSVKASGVATPKAFSVLPAAIPEGIPQ